MIHSDWALAIIFAASSGNIERNLAADKYPDNPTEIAGNQYDKCSGYSGVIPGKGIDISDGQGQHHANDSDDARYTG